MDSEPSIQAVFSSERFPWQDSNLCSAVDCFKAVHFWIIEIIADEFPFILTILRLKDSLKLVTDGWLILNLVQQSQ